MFQQMFVPNKIHNNIYIQKAVISRKDRMFWGLMVSLVEAERLLTSSSRYRATWPIEQWWQAWTPRASQSLWCTWSMRQDFAGLAWVRYEAVFQHWQATRSGCRSMPHFTACFTGMARSNLHCKLHCMATTHTERDCALQGTIDPGITDRLKKLESLVVAISPQSGKVGKEPACELSGKPCPAYGTRTAALTRSASTATCAASVWVPTRWCSVRHRTNGLGPLVGYIWRIRVPTTPNCTNPCGVDTTLRTHREMLGLVYSDSMYSILSFRSGWHHDNYDNTNKGLSWTYAVNYVRAIIAE